MLKPTNSTQAFDKKQIHFISLLSLVIFSLYIFINFLFPYAGATSVCFLAISVGIMLYCLIDQNPTLLLFSLISVIFSILTALLHHPFFIQ